MPLLNLDQTVIVAENDGQMRGLLRTMLEWPHRSVLPCSNGFEAVQLASQILADLVVLDLLMPRMGGIEACRAIRELPRYAGVPIVILTAFDEAHHKRRALSAGANRFLGKPVATAELLAVINPLIQAQKFRLDLEYY